MIADERDPVGGDHAEELLAGLGGGGLVRVEADFPFRVGQRPDVVVGGVGHQEHLLAARFHHVDHVARGMAEGGHAGDAGGHAAAITDELEAVGEGFHLACEGLVVGAVPVVELDLAGDVARIRIGQVARIVGHAADMVAVHVGDDDHGHVGGHDACRFQRGGGAGGAEAGVEEHHVIARAHNGRREEELRLVGGNEVLAADLGEFVGRDIHAKDSLDILDGAGSGQQRRDLEVAQGEGVLDRVLRPHGMASGQRGRGGEASGHRQRGGSGQHGAARHSDIGHGLILSG